MMSIIGMARISSLLDPVRITCYGRKSICFPLFFVK